MIIRTARGRLITRRMAVGGCVARALSSPAWADNPNEEFGCFITAATQARMRLVGDGDARRAATSGFESRAGLGRRIDPTADEDFLIALGDVLAGMAEVFDQNPSFEFYDDLDRDGRPSPNAKASTATRRDVPGTRGSVSFGVRMLEDFLRREGGDMAVFAVCAHEFAHIYQFHTSWKNKVLSSLPKYCLELHADYLAGFCLGHYALAYPDVDLQPVGPAWEGLGSSDFTHPDFHGTPEQRISAIEAGFALVQRDNDIEAPDAASRGYDFVAKLTR